MSERFCVNCRHYSLPAPDADPVCLHSAKPQDHVTDAFADWLVTGNGPKPQINAHYRCAIERKGIGVNDCGPNAIHFEAKP